ncbi:MAG: hypothetical protein P8129_25875 [Anaerolineae bacterium]
MEKEKERVLLIDIHITRGLLALLVLLSMAVVMVLFLVRDPAWAAASSVDTSLASSSALRQYYLTPSGYDGANATSACAAGYHMASMWEIVEPSSLKYNTDLGRTEGDSGQGPTAWPGWVRTGTMASPGAMPGEGNCEGWTENDSGASGTLANLSWGSANIHVWNAFTLPCDQVRLVWCVEDRLTIRVYLPCILRSDASGS